MSTEKKSPTDFVKFIYGRPVIVKLYSGLVYKGVLTCLDGYMNVVLEQAEEYENDEFKSRYNDCFIRGNNVIYLAPNDNV
ncbi:u6 snRNA-associated sm-like protein 6 [Blastocystis sp. subtype 4]|uniref:u6 snRNA-associated sm-like protein 6 n=1 Tax=Blastocystis sp. subtype 4 TaxID=944170 RepID=UPI00071148D4|nr:u6 snRNA-associated sm-like protein 6 [Blastocystis sp. subtype 4]KNB43491.1 u6 snRNA-associated sm-like protein 6 [Blastocystis sp. subtype 4]|eukprot:XP_014526934.1 u6 snRNA-associated sm-like protein 6 [Blastocystis sp. subtype 4]